MSREKGSQCIREALKKKDIDRWKRLEEIWRDAEPMFEAIEMTVDKPAGKAHSIEVEKDISALIPDDRKEELGPIELFSLSVAACLHDEDKGLDTPKGEHGDVASAKVGIDPDDYGLDLGEADVVRWIIRMHDHGDFRSELLSDPLPIGGGTEIHIRPLAALFKLADILHADYRRVVSARPTEAKERARICIRGWKYDDEGRIVFTAVPEELPDIEHIHKGIAMMREAIEPIAPILRDAGYAYEIANTEIDDSILIDKVKLKHEAKQKSKRSFIGMDSFNEDDEHLFKGREKESNELHELLLLDDPIIALVGDSGTGKTSLIRAGLFPKLRKAGWKFAYTRPLHEPASDVIREVWLRMMKGKMPDDMNLIEIFERVSEENRGRNILIVMDQFEDLFRFPDAPEQMAEALYPVQAMRFLNLRIILSYRADAEGQVGPILQNVSASPRGMPKKYLQLLDRDGAKEALTAGFEVAQVGFDPDVGKKDFMKLILADIEAQGSGFYPPYIQMIGETLTDRAENKIVTKSVYDSLGGAGNVIGNYLFNQLESFGDKRGDVERILVELTSVAGPEGRKARTRSTEDLERDLGMDSQVLTDLLGDMVKRRMIRPVDDAQYEIIHDHLARLVDENIIAVESEREFKKIREHLSTSAAIYSNTRGLLDPAVMAKLYQSRQRVKPSSQERIMLLHSCFAGKGPAWYWFREDLLVECLSEFQEMLKDGDQGVQTAAAQVLTQSATVPELRKILRDRGGYIQMAAAQTLAHLGNREAIPELREMLRDRGGYVQIAAAQALAKLDAREAIPELQEMLGEDGLVEVNREAARALMQLTDNIGNIPRLREMLNTGDINTRINAIQAIAELGIRTLIPELQKILRDESWPIQEAAAQALGRLQAVQATDELLAALRNKHEGWELRAAAAWALAQLGTRESIPELQEVLKDRNGDIRAAAARALAQLGVRESIPELREMLRDGDTDAQIAATEALAQLNDRESIPELLETLKDAYNSVQNAAATTLSYLASEEEILPLLEMIIQSGKGVSAANNALILIDRKLYCPFDWREIVTYSEPSLEWWLHGGI